MKAFDAIFHEELHRAVPATDKDLQETMFWYECPDDATDALQFQDAVIKEMRKKEPQEESAETHGEEALEVALRNMGQDEQNCFLVPLPDALRGPAHHQVHVGGGVQGAPLQQSRHGFALFLSAPELPGEAGRGQERSERPGGTRRGQERPGAHTSG